MNDVLDILNITDDDSEAEEIPPTVKVISEETLPAGVTKEEIDLETARKNLNFAANLGSQVLEKAADNAKSAADPEYYESFASVLKQVTEVNGKLVEIHQGKRNQPRATAGTFNQQNILVGTTADLQRIIKEAKNGNT